MFVYFFEYIQYLLKSYAVTRNSHILRITDSRWLLLIDFLPGNSFFG